MAQKFSIKNFLTNNSIDLFGEWMRLLYNVRIRLDEIENRKNHTKISDSVVSSSKIAVCIGFGELKFV